MTRMLASVTGPDEALVALAGGADIIDLKDPRTGALGAVSVATVRRTVAVIGGRRAVSAVTGDGPMSPAQARDSAEAMAETGVDYVKQGFPGDDAEAGVRALAPLAARTRLIAVLFADRAPDLSLLPLLAEAGFAGAMLDTAGKASGRLLTHLDLPALRGFVAACRRHGLLAGLAGSLEAPDVPRLLVLDPDLLGFRGALCGGAGREAPLDPAAVAAIRALIPPVDGGDAPATEGLAVPDRVFVRDLVLPVRIGAYAHEYGTPQRVRFEVEAEVARSAAPPGSGTGDMAGVFSYDVITDGIRLLVDAGHVALVETLAERLAALVLAHRSVLRVRIRLEKLDTGNGVVGCLIERTRPGAAR